jgi:hypothetical protein
MDDVPRRFQPLAWMIWRTMMVIAVVAAIGFGWLW